MKKYPFLSRIVLSCLAVSLSFISCSSGGGDDDDDKKVIVCFGDSLTAGMSATVVGEDDLANSYPAYLQAMLDTYDRGAYEVINAGVSGDTTADALARLQRDVIATDPDIVIICIGANDFMDLDTEQQWTNALDGWSSGLRSMLDTLDNGKRRLYVGNFINLAVATYFGEQSELEVDPAELVAMASDMLSELAPASSSTRVVISDIWDGLEGLMSADGIHPTAAGYRIMAENYFNALTE